MNPPRLALLTMRWLLPRVWREAIAGDLEEEWNTAPRRSRIRFWNLVLRSIAACWIHALGVRLARRPRNPRTGDSHMHSLLQDLGYGWRLMWRSPGFTLAAVATLALGIGANSAIFSIFNVLSLKPLPYREPARVAFVLGWDVEENERRFNLRLADFFDLQRRSESLESVAAYTYSSANLTGGDIPERVQAYRVTLNTFDLLGVAAAAGRVFEASETREDVAVLSHGLWQRRFGGDPSIIGRGIVLNGRPHEIIGVMPPRFEFPVFNFKGDVWIPWRPRDGERGQPAATASATVVARVRPDASYAQAQAELDMLMRAFATEHPETNRGLSARLVEMGRLDEEQAGPAIPLVLATVSLVLLLACANVANLLLARGVTRHRELALRAAIGASRLRIARQLLVEGLLLALAGGVAGVVLAMFALQALRASLPEILLTTLPNVEEIGMDSATLGYTLAMSLVTSIVFGLVPAWRAAREDLQDGLKESASAGGSRGTRRLRTGLVVAEVALSTLLLVGAGLLARSYGGLQRVDPGFVADGVLTMTLTLPDYIYTSARQRLQFYEAALARIERLPGVVAAGFVNVLPFSTYDRGARLTIDGRPAPEPGRAPAVAYRVASPRYFETMRIPVLEGRAFDQRDSADGAPVAIVNQTLARRFLAGGSALGRRVRLGSSADSPWLTVVGVIGDVYHSELTADPDPEVHVPIAQAPAAMMMLAVRAGARPEDLTRSVRAEINAIDPAQAVYHVKTLDRMVGDSLLPRSMSAALMLVFSALALLLAAIGVYGVVAYGVSQRTRELGLRIALGATPRDLLLVVLRGGVAMIGAGIVIGIGGALAISRLLAGALYGVGPADPLTYAAVVGLLAVTGLAACVVPAWRASATQAVTALRAN